MWPDTVSAHEENYSLFLVVVIDVQRISLHLKLNIYGTFIIFPQWDISADFIQTAPKMLNVSKTKKLVVKLRAN